MKVDLHIHTKFSDGGLELQEVFNKLKEQSVKVISITDHNNIDAYSGLDNVEMYGINIIKGVEIDVEYEGIIYHILMYNFQDCVELKQYFDKSKQKDKNEFYRMVKDVKNSYNLKIDDNKVENFIKRNQYFDKVRLNNFLVENGFCTFPEDAFYTFTKNIKDKERLVISAKDFFYIAKKSNAITVLAHPIKYLKKLETIEKLKSIILELKKLGLHGIEVYNNRQTLVQQQELLNFSIENNFLISGGSDFHSKIGCDEKKVLGEALGNCISKHSLSILKAVR